MALNSVVCWRWAHMNRIYSTVVARSHSPLVARAYSTVQKVVSDEDVWLCKKQTEKAVVSDLQALASSYKLKKFTVTQQSEGVVVTKGALSRMYNEAAWPTQVLPRCAAVTATSVRTLASEACKLAFQELIDIGSKMELPRIVVHAVVNDSSLQGRCNLVKDHFHEEMKSRSKRLSRLASDSTPVPQNIPFAIIQLFMINPETILVSTSTTSCNLPSSAKSRKSHQSFGWSRPFPWEGGLTGIPKSESKLPPSRAYQKLDEILEAIGTRPIPKSLVADVGSAPGGWTHRLAIDMKCRVLSVDRSPLDEELTKHKNVTHFIADGSAWVPEKKVDWLFCDMALPAHKSVDVLSKWVNGRLCEHFAWTIKFVGSTDYSDVLSKLRTSLSGLPFAIRHLPSHGNEIVVLGTTRELRDKSNN